MDIRDLQTWSEEAEIARLVRRAEGCRIALLPHRKAEDVNKEVEALNWRIYELEYGDRLDDLDKKAQEKRKKRADELRKKKEKRIKNG